MLRDVMEVSGLFLKLGTTAFGGPAVHIAMMRREAVERRKWLSERDFLDLLGATNLIPGPNSTEMALHIGYLRAGCPGLIAAGVCFIVPAMLIVSAFAWIYARSGTVPQIGWLLYGVKPVVAALIVHAVWGLGRAALKDAARKAGFIAVLALYFAGANEIGLLAGAGLIAWAAGSGSIAWPQGRRGVGKAGVRPSEDGVSGGTGRSGTAQPEHGGSSPELGNTDVTKPPRSPEGSDSGAGDGEGTADDRRSTVPWAGTALIGGAGAAAAGPALAAATPFTLTLLFLKFLKIGSVLYGSGYVLLPFLRSEFVQRSGWLSESQILDAVSVGQFTPGPFFTTATFIGHVLGGWRGGLLATAGIFLPAFFFVAIANPWIPRLRNSRAFARILDGVNTASLALMAGAAWQMGKASVMDWATAALAVLALYLLFRRNAPSTWLIVGGGLIGIAARSLA